MVHFRTSTLSKSLWLLAATAAFFLLTIAAYFNVFGKITHIVRDSHSWQASGMAVGLVALVACGLSLFAFIALRNGHTSKNSKLELIKDLATRKVQDDGDAAVFIIEMGDGMDEERLNKAAEQLELLMGKRRLTFFRIR